MYNLINKVRSFTILLFVIFSFHAFPQSLQDSLLIHYKFDGDSLDSSGNDFHPTFFQASYAEDVVGNPNSAIYLNGDGDYVVLPDSSELKPDFPLTISFWINMDSITPQSNVYFTNDFNYDAHSGVWLNLSSNHRMALSFGDGNGFGPSNRRSKLTNVSLQINIWYFVAGVIWNVNDMKIYINGVEESGYVEGGAFYLEYDGLGGNIGRKDANYYLKPYYFTGYLDDFRYWNRGLTDDEIYSLYDQVVGISTSVNDNTILIYPNPATDNIQLNLPDRFLNYQINIYNSMGRLVSIYFNLKEIDVSKLPNGLYFIKIVDDKSKEGITTKFIKN